MNVLSRSALILIDVQKGIDEAEHWGGNRNNPDAEQNIERLLSEWRKTNGSVVIVQHDSRSPKSPFRPGQTGNDLKDFVMIKVGEKHVKKSTTSAFVGTDLSDFLSHSKITSLVMTGFVTNNSVEATARHAADLGYNVTVVSDAVACFDKAGIDGSKYPSKLVHQISLSNLEGEYATIKSTDEVITTLKASGQQKRT